MSARTRKLAVSLTWDEWQRVSEVLGVFSNKSSPEILHDTWIAGERKQFANAQTEISRVMLRGGS